MFDAFDPYVRELEQLANSGSSLREADFKPHLDGEAGRQLRVVASIDELRRAGAFFTGEALASRLLALVPSDVEQYFDLACGGGDLLLAASARLPVAPSLRETLLNWNRRLAGRDLVPEFVRATRARLVMSAISRGARPEPDLERPTDLLDSISTGDGLQLRPGPGSAVLLNPPYGRAEAPDGCTWTSGQTTTAALFMDLFLSTCSPNVRVAALLPEVLRAGTRYQRFRSEMERRLEISSVEPAGIFDAATDVDVFLLAGRTGNAGPYRGTANWLPVTPKSQLGDLCRVRIGPVVANRDPHRGPWRLYVEARDIGGDGEISPTRHRRFLGTVFDPPFVVVGRTNRADRSSGRPRLRATVVRGLEPIAVENHLVALLPKQKSLRSCRDIAHLVQTDIASDFMDRRLRCRHLTVSALKELPR